MRWALTLVLLGCVTERGAELSEVSAGPSAAHEMVKSFVAACEARQFEAVHALLAKPLRERYSVERLANDFAAEPRAADRLALIKLQLTRTLVEAADTASLEWATGKSLRLVREAEGWRISALE